MSHLRVCVLLVVLSMVAACADSVTPVPQRVVTGRVVAHHDGAPIEGALVTCQGEDAVTGADGRFAVSIPLNESPGRTDTLRVKAEGFGDSRKHEARDDPVEVRLRMSFAVSGRVVDSKGRPVPGATVRVRCRTVSQNPQFHEAFEEKSTADRDGRFRVERISREFTSQDLTVQADGHGTRTVPVMIDPDETRDGRDVGEIEVVAAAAVRLAVRGPDGEPLPDIRVTLGKRYPREVTTAEDGTARFDNLEPGRHEFIAWPRGLQKMATHVDVEQAGGTVDATLAAHFDRTLTFLVRDVDGKPVPGATVVSSYFGWSTNHRTGEDGRCTLRGLPEKAARFRVSARELGFFLVLVGPYVPAGQEVAVILRPTSLITGRVTGHDGAPTTGVRVRAMDPRIDLYATCRSDTDGGFRLEVPRGMPLRLEALQRRPAPETRRRKVTRQPPKAHGVAENVIAPATDVRIVLGELPVNRSLTVVVLSPDGTPLEGAEVLLSGSGGHSRTDADGKQGFTGLVGWRTKVSARLRRGRTDLVAPAPIVVVPADQEIVLRARSAALLRGTILQMDGSSAPRAEIEVVTDDGVLIRGKSDEEGGFSVPILPGRRHSFTAHYVTQEGFSCRIFREGVMPGNGELELRVRPTGW